MDKKLIICIVVIIIILGAVYFGQQAYSRAVGKTLISDATNQVQTLVGKGSNWAMSQIYPKISGAVQNGGDAITKTLDQTKKNISETVTQKIGNYFSGIANAIAGKDNTACPTTPSK